MKIPRLIVAVTVPQQCTQHLRGQLAFARQAGFEVGLVCSPGELSELVAGEEGVALLPVVMEREVSPLRDAKALMRAVRTLRGWKPDITNAGSPKAGLIVTFAAWLCRVPVRVYLLRGMRFETATGLRRVVLRAIEKLVCRAATHVICISPSLRESAVAQGIVPRKKSLVLGAGSSNGLDVAKYTRTPENDALVLEVKEKLGIAPGDFVIGYVGRLVRDKGIIELVAAWLELREEFPRLHMVMVGPFEDGDRIPADTEQLLRDDPRVHLAGHLPGGVTPYYAVMDVLTLPSYREGFGNVLIEASCMEIPTVASDIPGIRDAVADGETGTLVPPRDAEALRQALAVYLRDPELRRLHGQAGRTRVTREFPQENLWALQVETYRELLKGRSCNS